VGHVVWFTGNVVDTQLAHDTITDNDQGELRTWLNQNTRRFTLFSSGYHNRFAPLIGIQTFTTGSFEYDYLAQTDLFNLDIGGDPFGSRREGFGFSQADGLNLLLRSSSVPDDDIACLGQPVLSANGGPVVACEDAAVGTSFSSRATHYTTPFTAFDKSGRAALIRRAINYAP